MPGYPDFQRYTSRIGSNMLGQAAWAIPVSGETLGPYTVVNWGGVLLHCKPSTGYGTVTLDWSDTDTLIETITSQFWVVSSDIAVDVAVPVQAQYLQVTFNNSYGATVQAGMTLRGLAAAGPDLAYPVAGQPVQVSGHVLAASSDVFFYGPQIRRGVAYLAIDPADATGSVTYDLVAVNPDGTTEYGLARFGAPTASTNLLIAVPDVAIALHCTNTDAGSSHTFSVRLSYT